MKFNPLRIHKQVEASHENAHARAIALPQTFGLNTTFCHCIVASCAV